MFIDDVLKEYIYEIRLRNYTERTIKGYRNNLSKWARYCNEELNVYELEELNHLHIKKYLTLLKEKGLSESYIDTSLFKALKRTRKGEVRIEGYPPILGSKRSATCIRTSESFIKSFGIIALIDEATNYQESRGKDELQILLSKFISDKLQPYSKQFPKEYFEELFRLYEFLYDPTTTLNQ